MRRISYPNAYVKACSFSRAFFLPAPLYICPKKCIIAVCRVKHGFVVLHRTKPRKQNPRVFGSRHFYKTKAASYDTAKFKRG